ncbi:hypothetical protein GYMLUDRAFT_250668 [Collybiopsis luxurians FD-317 M1]|uniref:Protein kinase domain-containing protein n=1 Tax=Collybiopsis luxurians FD-317 M1 TaxID=944289 RepID=A0A0D0ARU6_9AGAR|nr:hypothetical protein GYMLUDRAFT_250668 [Collybiopsis luxurians FD-317 M1]
MSVLVYHYNDTGIPISKVPYMVSPATIREIRFELSKQGVSGQFLIHDVLESAMLERLRKAEERPPNTPVFLPQEIGGLNNLRTDLFIPALRDLLAIPKVSSAPAPPLPPVPVPPLPPVPVPPPPSMPASPPLSKPASPPPPLPPHLAPSSSSASMLPPNFVPVFGLPCRVQGPSTRSKEKMKMKAAPIPLLDPKAVAGPLSREPSGTSISSAIGEDNVSAIKKVRKIDAPKSVSDFLTIMSHPQPVSREDGHTPMILEASRGSGVTGSDSDDDDDDSPQGSVEPPQKAKGTSKKPSQLESVASGSGVTGSLGGISEGNDACPHGGKSKNWNKKKKKQPKASNDTGGGGSSPSSGGGGGDGDRDRGAGGGGGNAAGTGGGGGRGGGRGNAAGTGHGGGANTRSVTRRNCNGGKGWGGGDVDRVGLKQPAEGTMQQQKHAKVLKEPPSPQQVMDMLVHCGYSDVAQAGDTLMHARKNCSCYFVKYGRQTFPEMLFYVRKITHINIIEAVRIIKWDSFMCAVLPTYSVLENLLSDKTQYASRFLSMSYDLVNGALYLHSLGIAHMDIKPENLVYNSDFVLKYIDFNLILPVKDDIEKIDSGF